MLPRIVLLVLAPRTRSLLDPTIASFDFNKLTRADMDWTLYDHGVADSSKVSYTQLFQGSSPADNLGSYLILYMSALLMICPF